MSLEARIEYYLELDPTLSYEEALELVLQDDEDNIWDDEDYIENDDDYLDPEDDDYYNDEIEEEWD